MEIQIRIHSKYYTNDDGDSEFAYHVGEIYHVTRTETERDRSIYSFGYVGKNTSGQWENGCAVYNEGFFRIDRFDNLGKDGLLLNCSKVDAANLTVNDVAGMYDCEFDYLTGNGNG